MLRCTGNVEVYTRSTDIYWAPSASAGRTTHLNSWEPTVWNHVRNRELHCHRRRAKSGPSYSCGNGTASRYYEYTPPLFLAFFPSPKTEHEFSRRASRARARAREPVSVGYYFGLWTHVVFMLRDSEYVTYVSIRIACYVNIFLRQIALTKKYFRFKYRPREICYEITLL